MRRLYLLLLFVVLGTQFYAYAFSSKNYQMWDRGQEVQRLQQFLNQQGFLVAQEGVGSPGNETTIFGVATYRALTRFQEAHGLPATGYLGEMTRSLIASLSNQPIETVPRDAAPVTSLSGVSDSVSDVFSQNYQMWDRGQEVKRLQQFLNQQGFLVAQEGVGSPGNETTIFGVATYRALTRFQEAYDLPVTGFLGPVTRERILSKFFKSISSAGSNITAAIPTSDSKQVNGTSPSTGGQPTYGYIFSSASGGGVLSPPVVPTVSVSTSSPVTSATSTPPSSSTSTPLTCTLTSSAKGIGSGESATLTWNSVGASSLMIMPIGVVDLFGSRVVSPATTTTYALTATDAQGSLTTCTTTLRVYSHDNKLSPLGTNLDAVKYWSSSYPFLDAFKSSTGYWYTQNGSTWDTNEQAKLDLDSDGWVKSLTPLNNQSASYTYVASFLFNGRGGNYFGGRYLVLYNGTGTLAYRWDAVKNVALSTPGRDVIDVTPTAVGFLIQILATDPLHTGDYIRNIRVVRESDEAALLAGQIFAPEFIEKTKHYKVLRYMDWMQTNGSTQSTWDNRPKPNDTAYSTKGVPAEVMVKLANKLYADPWFTLPHQATDDYITRFAELAHEQLDPGRKVYVEYSNELWNNGFTQTYYTRTQGVLLWPSQASTSWVAGWNYVGYQTAHMCDIWKSVWGADSSRVVCVLGSQAAVSSIAKTMLDCSLWTGSGGNCAQHVDALAIAPYFGSSATLDNLTYGWSTSTTQTQAIDNVFNEIEQGGHLQEAFNWMISNKAVADSYGLPLIAYEGGQHMVDESLRSGVVNIYSAAQRDSRMKALYLKYFAKWREIGGGIFAHFTDIGGASQYGAWGSLESILATSSPKFDALQEFIATTPCWWLGCMDESISDIYSPYVALLYPLGGSTISSSTVMLAASSTDASGVAGVVFSVDGVPLGSEITTRPYTTTWDVSTFADGVHQISVAARDMFNNISIASSSVTVFGLPPVISSTTSSVSTSSATITWMTDKNATSQIVYGTTTFYTSSSTLDAQLSKNHTITLTNLAQATTYHYSVQSVDAIGRVATSTDYFLTTSDSIPTPALSFIGSGSIWLTATSSWTATSAPLGVESPSRRVIALLAGQGGTIAGATIGGVPATTLFYQKANGGISWVAGLTALVPTGTTGDISVSMSHQIFGNGYYGIYTVDDTSLASSTPSTGVASVTLGSTLFATATEITNGFVVGVTNWANATGKNPINVPDFTMDSTMGGRVFFSKSHIPQSGLVTATTTWLGNFEAQTGVAAWR